MLFRSLEAANTLGLSPEEFFKVCLGRGIAAEIRDLNGVRYFEATKNPGGEPGHEDGDDRC